MARAKKKETLTPEERLQAALVPDWEQPYKVPENWCWVRLDKLYQVNPKNIADDHIEAAFIPMEKIEPGMVSKYTFEKQPWCKAKKGHTQFADGDVAFAKISPCFENRKSMLLNNLPNGIGGGTTELIILRQPKINQKFTFYFISNEQFIHGGTATYSGTVGQQRISMDYVKNYPIPLSPLPEQQRIVDRIESLFAKLDEAKEKVQATLDSFEPRKAAILHKAFIGELTTQWRKEHGVGMEKWKSIALKDIIELLSGQDFPPNKYNSIGNGLPYITGASNLAENHIVINRWTPEPSVIAERNDVLLVCKGSGYGKAAIADFDQAHIARQIMALRANDKIRNIFLFYFLQNQIKYIRANGKGLIPGISRKIILDMQIQLPAMNEQLEIVRILDDLLTKEQQAKEAAEAVLEQIDLIKKSILARAFRGELGTNDPSEESAKELLLQIFQQEVMM